MNLLLDTNVLLWWLAGESIDPAASDAIAEPDNIVYVSAASIWEISIKTALGKLTVDADLDEAMGDDFERLKIDFEHALRAGGLPAHHRDPFDRMLIAQALGENLTLVTRDSVMPRYDVQIITA